jgi:hypothetical protein
LTDGAIEGLARLLMGQPRGVLLDEQSNGYHALWPKTVIPVIGILYNEAAKLGCLAASVTDGAGCFLPARAIGTTRQSSRPAEAPWNKSRDATAIAEGGRGIIK